MKEKLLDATVWKFLLVGVVNTIVGCGTMSCLYNLAHCSYWVSSAANYVVGGVVSFFLNKYFTFRNREKSAAQVLKFALTVAACYLIGYGLAKPLAMRLLAGTERSIQENAAMLIGMCLYTGLNYLGQRFFAFKKQ